MKTSQSDYDELQIKYDKLSKIYNNQQIDNRTNDTNYQLKYVKLNEYYQNENLKYEETISILNKSISQKTKENTETYYQHKMLMDDYEKLKVFCN